jgi:transcription elongation factor Elf1
MSESPELPLFADPADAGMERIGDILDRILPQLTVETASGLLPLMECPMCGIKGSLTTFTEANNNGIGLCCSSCGERHPFIKHKVQWLRQGPKRRKTTIRALMKERGYYCWLCGSEYAQLRAAGIGMHVHHTRSFADHGDEVEKIPLCAVCHDFASAIQRQQHRLFTALLTGTTVPREGRDPDGREAVG